MQPKLIKQLHQFLETYHQDLLTIEQLPPDVLKDYVKIVVGLKDEGASFLTHTSKDVQNMITELQDHFPKPTDQKGNDIGEFEIHDV